MNIYLNEAFNLDKLKTELENKGSEFYFIYIDKKLAGYFKINEYPYQTDINDPICIEIERIYLDSEFHSMGIGQIMLNKAIRISKQRNKDYVWLGVWEHNNRARKFYKKNGFYDVDTHDFYMGNDKQLDFIMYKDL